MGINKMQLSIWKMMTRMTMKRMMKKKMKRKRKMRMRKRKIFELSIVFVQSICIATQWNMFQSVKKCLLWLIFLMLVVLTLHIGEYSSINSMCYGLCCCVSFIAVPIECLFFLYFSGVNSFFLLEKKKKKKKKKKKS